MSSTNIILKRGPWNLTDLSDVQKHGRKVFSCFHCGGGSTMGYKLAGFDVLGGVEIDPEMMEAYRRNHHPRHSFLMGVQDFKKIPDADLPRELFDLDILDGSPPCSSFSMSGSREEKWGKAKKFREGQAVQILDDLFFHFIDIAKKLQPRVVVAENVKGLILGNARGYVKEIFAAFKDAGYSTQLFLLNSSRMGCPQSRERTFFIARRVDLGVPALDLDFNETLFPVSEAIKGVSLEGVRELTAAQLELWQKCSIGKAFSSVHPTGSRFNSMKLAPNRPTPTVTASSSRGAGGLYHWREPRQLSPREYARVQTFPDDYQVALKDLVYLCGMSVPPFMMQRVAASIFAQCFGGRKREENAMGDQS